MTELLKMFLLQKEIADFFKRKQLSKKEIPSDELFRTIRSVSGLESLTASRNIEKLLIHEKIITKADNLHHYYVNPEYDFSKIEKEIEDMNKPFYSGTKIIFPKDDDLKGWNVAHYKRDLPEDLIENETPFVCVDDGGVPHIVYARNDDSWNNVLFEKYQDNAVFLPVLWKRLDIPENVFGILNNTNTNPFGE